MRRLLPAALVLALAPTAGAYVLYTSPAFDAVPLRWTDRSTAFIQDSNQPEEIDASRAQEAIAASFDVWKGLTCNGVALGWTFTNDGVVSGRTIGFDERAGAANENLVKWVGTGWDHQSNVVALTSLTYDLYTGEIVDADIEINDRNFRFALVPGREEMDLQNTVVHEIGHFLGLDHSTKEFPDATMFASAPPQETKKRDLTQDDIDGYCALYGAGAAPWPVVIGTLPPKGQESACTQEVTANSTTIRCGPELHEGCSAGLGTSARGSAIGVLALALGLLLLRRC